MKNVIRVLVVFALMVFMTACGAEEGERAFFYEEDGITSTFTYEHKGDEVTKYTSEVELEYALLGLDSKEEAEEFFEMMVDEDVLDVDGVSQQIDYKDESLVETIVIDYTEADMKEIKEIPDLEFRSEIENGISMEGTAELLEEQGFEEITDEE